MDKNNFLFQSASEAVMELNLDRIKLKLMHVESGEGWSQEKTDSVEREYRRFLCLMKIYPDEDTAPLMDVDTFWHYHILDTMKYAADCEKVFGYFLHHYPYVGLRGDNDSQFRVDSGERMRVLYENTFGEAYIKPQIIDAATPATAFCAGPHAETAFCAGPHISNQPVRMNAATAFCAGPHIHASPLPSASAASAVTAFCAGPHAQTAFCAGPHIEKRDSHNDIIAKSIIN